MINLLKIKILIFLVLLVAQPTFAQNKAYLKIFFLYGSKPAHGNGKLEKREFGGLHGGHVSIGMDTMVISFHHVQGYHIFPHRSHSTGIYEHIAMKDFVKDTANKKYTTFIIPVDSADYVVLQKTISDYLVKTPYDYAFFGMRCASAAYEMLGIAHIFKHEARFKMILTNFYPKRLRRKCFKMARERRYNIIYQQGRQSRIWERN